MILAGSAAAVQAQSNASATQLIDEGLRRQAERERQAQEALNPHRDALRAPAGASAIPELPTEDPCFIASDIALVGPDAARFKWLAAATDTFLNRCIGARGVSRIVAYLDGLLIEQGYVTSRIGIGQQNLANGRLELRLQTGRIASIRMVDASAPGKPADDRWGTWVNAFPTREGRLLDAQALEQGVEQMKRLPSQSVSTVLTPGAEADTTVVTIERQAGSLTDRIRGGISFDNSGSAALGRTQLSANLALDNALGLNDIAGISFNSNAEQTRSDRRSQSASFNYSIPAGYSTLSLSASHARFAQAVQLTTTTTLSTGTSDSTELKWQHVAYRSASAKAGVYGSLSTRRSSSYLDDVELVTQRRRTTFFEAGVNVKKLFANGASVEVEAGYRRGVGWLSAEADLTPDPLDPGAVPTLRPRLLTFSGSLHVPFEQQPINGWPGRSFEYSATLKAQYTHDHALTIDQIGIGGRNTVRGFDGDAVLLAESGWTLRNELTTPLKLPALDSSLYIGVDAGRVWGISDANLIGQFLAGTAIGIRGRFSAWPSLQFDLAVATPLVMPEGFKTARVSAYASATYAF